MMVGQWFIPTVPGSACQKRPVPSLEIRHPRLPPASPPYKAVATMFALQFLKTTCNTVRQKAQIRGGVRELRLIKDWLHECFGLCPSLSLHVAKKKNQTASSSHPCHTSGCPTPVLATPGPSSPCCILARACISGGCITSLTLSACPCRYGGGGLCSLRMRCQSSQLASRF